MFPDRQQIKAKASIDSIGPIAKFLGFQETNPTNLKFRANQGKKINDHSTLKNDIPVFISSIKFRNLNHYDLSILF